MHIFGHCYIGYSNKEISYIKNLIQNNKKIIYLYDPIPNHILLEKLKKYDVGISFRTDHIKDAVDISSKILEFSNEGIPVIINDHKINIKLYGNDYPCYIKNLDELLLTIEKIFCNNDTYNLAVLNGYKACEQYHLKTIKNNFDRL